MKPGLYRGLTSLALSSALFAGGVAVATGASATTTPPWEPDPGAVGTIAFYDASGNQITSGSTDVAPFAAYAVGSTAIRSGDAQAQLMFANPDPSANPGVWYKESAGLYSQLPLTTGPANVQTLSQTQPVVVGSSSDQTLDGFESDSIISTTAGYQNVVQIRIRTANSFNQPTLGYDSADISIDPATHTWQEIYPAAATTSAPGAPTAVSAVAGNAAATVSWTAPAGDGGSALTGYTLQYSADAGTTWTATPHTGTTTSQVVSGLTDGQAYVFRVAAVNAIGTSDFSTPSAAVTPQADATALSISGPARINYGATATFTTRLTDTRTNTVLPGQRVSLYRRTSSTAAWVAIRAATTNSAGVGGTAFKIIIPAQYQWRYAGDAQHKASASAVFGETVVQVVSVALSAARIHHGGVVSIYGTVGPAVSGQRVYLQQDVHGAWRATALSAVIKYQRLPNRTTAVAYLLNARLSTIGSYRFRMYKPATATFSAGYSVPFTVTVVR